MPCGKFHDDEHKYHFCGNCGKAGDAACLKGGCEGDGGCMWEPLGDPEETLP